MKIAARIKWFSGAQNAYAHRVGIARPKPHKLLAELAPFDPELIEDDVGHGEWPTGRRAILSALSGDGAVPSHILIIEDDALLCADFARALPDAIQKRPDNVIMLFQGSHPQHPSVLTKAVLQARQYGLTWVDQNADCFGPGLVIPFHLAAHFLVWCEDNISAELSKPTTDNQLRLWALATNRTISITVPSLVEHDPQFDSILDNGPNRDRQATYWTPEAPQTFTQTGVEHFVGDVRIALSRERQYFKRTATVLKEFHLGD